ncbi:MAG: dTDP-4-dehydrorhamnose reductase [Muribaculaceae bacterium]|nr:dTDP-4-dehydrorhamnose reductase [Muribaculaceae bacterium]
MKILITGSKGQLGRELNRLFERDGANGAEVVFTDVDELDITDRGAVDAFLRAGDFSHVVNCAAYTAVDRAEEDKALCYSVNTDGPGNLARLADELGFRLIHISTDYVFDGTAHRPLTESDKPSPLSVYGTTKRRGETALLGLAPESIIIRTAGLYSAFGSNFIKTMIRFALQGRPQVQVVYDQIGAPTSAIDLAMAIRTILFSNKWKGGIYHYSNEGVCSWYDVAREVFDALPDSVPAPELLPILSSEFPAAASRPLYGVLDHSRIRATYGLRIPHWRHSLRRDFPEIFNSIKSSASL